MDDLFSKDDPRLIDELLSYLSVNEQDVLFKAIDEADGKKQRKSSKRSIGIKNKNGKKSAKSRSKDLQWTEPRDIRKKSPKRKQKVYC
jgi:hypothetical protein